MAGDGSATKMDAETAEELELGATAPGTADDDKTSEEENSTEIMNRIMKRSFKPFKLLVQKSEQAL
jgi:hypothetical protein